MGTSVYLPSKRKVRGVSKAAKQKIVRSYLVDTFTIAFEQSNGKVNLIDFLPVFQKYVKGENLKYANPSRFKKFKVEGDRIFWGRNEDITFSIPSLLHGSKKKESDILYII